MTKARFNTDKDRKRNRDNARRQHELVRRRDTLERRLRPLVTKSPDGYLVSTYRGSDPITKTVTVAGYSYVITGTSFSLSGDWWNLEPPPYRIYKSGFAEVVNKNSRRMPKLRPWRTLSKRELDIIDSYDWKVSETKHPLEYLGEALDDGGR